MYLTADFGASNTRVASSFDLKTFKRIEKFKTKESFSEQVALLNNVFLDLSSGQHIDGICIGIAGKLDFKSKKVVKAVNYSPLNGKRFDEIVERRVSTHEVVIENDALLAGLGESVFGAGKKFNVVAYINFKYRCRWRPCRETGNKVVVLSF
jgi:predicted NBD/HSP70 family sugar kinase